MVQVHPFSTFWTRPCLAVCFNRRPPPRSLPTPMITIFIWVDTAPHVCMNTVLPYVSLNGARCGSAWLCTSLMWPHPLCVPFPITRASVRLCSVVPVAHSSSPLSDHICTNVQHYRCLSCVQRSCGLLTLNHALTHNHTHSRSHTHSHTHNGTHTLTHPHAYTRNHMLTHPHNHHHTHNHTLIITYTVAHPLTLIPTQSHTFTQPRAYTHNHMFTQSHVHTCTLINHTLILIPHTSLSVFLFLFLSSCAENDITLFIYLLFFKTQSQVGRSCLPSACLCPTGWRAATPHCSATTVSSVPSRIARD